MTNESIEVRDAIRTLSGAAYELCRDSVGDGRWMSCEYDQDAGCYRVWFERSGKRYAIMLRLYEGQLIYVRSDTLGAFVLVGEGNRAGYVKV